MKFIDICKGGNIQEIIKAINSGAEINAKDNDSYTALTLAARNGHTDTVNALIQAGADDLTTTMAKPL